MFKFVNNLYYENENKKAMLTIKKSQV